MVVRGLRQSYRGSRARVRVSGNPPSSAAVACRCQAKRLLNTCSDLLRPQLGWPLGLYIVARIHPECYYRIHNVLTYVGFCKASRQQEGWVVVPTKTRNLHTRLRRTDISISAQAALSSFKNGAVSLAANENGLLPTSGLRGLMGSANSPSSLSSSSAGPNALRD